MIKKITIFDKNNHIINRFLIEFQERESSELKLDPKDFYHKHSGHMPEKTVEMMIDGSVPFTIAELQEARTHIQQGTDDEWYISYPHQINTMDDAIQIAKDWCLSTVFHMQEPADVSWFESFGDWMTLAAKANRKIPKSFKQFHLWLQQGPLKLRVEISEGVPM